MGLEEKPDSGLDIEDLVNIYKGHIKDRYQVFYITTLLSTVSCVTDYVVPMFPPLASCSSSVQSLRSDTGGCSRLQAESDSERQDSLCGLRGRRQPGLDPHTKNDRQVRCHQEKDQPAG